MSSMVGSLKAALSQRWFRLSILAGVVVIGVFLPLASTAPDGLERTIESLIQPIDTTLMLMMYGEVTGETGPLSAWLTFLGIQYLLRAPMPDYVLIQLSPGTYISYLLEMMSALQVMGLASFEIPEEVAALLISAAGGHEYLATLTASLIGFFVTLGAAWIVGFSLKKRGSAKLIA
ncbi:MAG: PDGLE domain-containing protein [Candidatus Jordarchaeales archaeon]